MTAMIFNNIFGGLCFAVLKNKLNLHFRLVSQTYFESCFSNWQNLLLQKVTSRKVEFFFSFISVPSSNFFACFYTVHNFQFVSAMLCIKVVGSTKSENHWYLVHNFSAVLTVILPQRSFYVCFIFHMTCFKSFLTLTRLTGSTDHNLSLSNIIFIHTIVEFTT